MKLATLSRRLLPHLTALLVLFTGNAARADFKSGQLADRSLGDALSYSGGYGSLRAMGMAVDPVSHKLFVADPLKHRILRFASSASLEDGAAPEAVLGQLDFQSAGPQPLPSGLNEPTGLAMDAQGRLWVADTGNHRVLRFDNAASLASGSPPAGVLGQSRIDAVSNPLTIVAGRMQEPTGLCVSTDGTLWVADRGNNRVLRFDNAAARPAGAAADAVLGQADFTHGSPALGADRMNTPFTVAAEIAYNAQLKPITRLWVADYANNRVLSFDDARAKPNGSAADRVLGQPDFLSAGVGVQHVVGPSALVVSNNRLWVADRGNHRVLRYDNASTKANGAAADGVLGQLSLTTWQFGTGAAQFNKPRALALDGGRLWVSDWENSRVLRFENAPLKSNGANADGVLGFPYLPVAGVAPVGARCFGSAVRGLAVDPETGKLFVCDRANNRVLRFASAAALETNAAAEAVFGQQDFTSTAAGAAANQLYSPSGAAVDHFGHLWVADYRNNRVVRYDNASSAPSGIAASQVLGQSGFNLSSESVAANRMTRPVGLAVESKRVGAAWVTMNLWVGDNGSARVLRFPSPHTAASGSSAAVVLGQPDFISSTVQTTATGLGAATALCVDTAGTLWVADEYSSRILRYDFAATKANGAAANGVLLQPDFITRTTPATPTASNGICAGLAVSNAGRLYACDFSGARVLWFNNAATRANGATADGVLGAPDFVTQGSFDPGWNNMGQTAACVMDRNGRLWVGGSYVVGPQPFGIVLRFRPTLESAAEFRQDYFGNTAQSLTADSDGDGVANLMEYAQDTDPTDAASVKRLRIYASPGSRPEIICNFPYPAKTDLRLTFQYSPNMQPGWWSTLCQRSGSGAWSGAWLPYVGPETGDVAVRHTTAYPTPAAFYRMKVEVLP